MSLISEIKCDLTNKNEKIANTLRKAKILASNIKLKEFKDWIKYELEGYPDKEKLPNYRKHHAHNFGTFSGPFGRIVNNFQIPSFNLPDVIKETVNNLYFYDGISEIESMLKVKGSSLQEKWPQEAVMLARDYVKLSGNMELIEAHKIVTKSMLEGIVDNVKNKLLDFILELEESEILTESEKVKPGAMEQARNLFNINISGNNNVVAGGENVTQNIMKVKENDIDSLCEYFKQNNIPQEDIIEIKEAIKSDGDLSNKTFGTKVNEWMGKMISKSASGLWSMALHTAPVILTEGLKLYYGF